jgi:23S rRNA C2498 (ribose-2'-O)-methylase RlmM
MPKLFLLKDGPPACPQCNMRMIVVDGYKLEPKRQTFECLRCGHIEKPGRHEQAAE